MKLKMTYNRAQISAIAVTALMMTALPAAARHIVSVPEIAAECPAGEMPRLPYLVNVKYDDGTQEYRQTRWRVDNATVEKELTDTLLYPAGSEYVITGFVVGDRSSLDGYPLQASVSVTADRPTTPTVKAHTFPLDRVQLLGDNRLTRNRDLALREICSWDPAQQLYNYRDTYGLPTDAYPYPDGWDSPDVKLKGHGSGHYMSALAFAFASATDSVQKNLLRRNIIRMVNELRECQERTFVYDESLGRYREARDLAPEQELQQLKGTWSDFDRYKKDYEHYGYGYLNAIPAQHPLMVEMYRPYNNTDWVWAPYYSIHKQLAGLIDIATYIDDEATCQKALRTATDMGLWIWNRLKHRTYLQTEGTSDERRARPGNRYEMWNIYIAGEDGGVSESLARLAQLSNNPEESARLLEASNFFDSPAFFDPLSRNADGIRGRHANQHIPKITGILQSYVGNHNPYYYNIADNFWHIVRSRYSYSPGGVGNGEMFRQPYTQTMSMAMNTTSDMSGALVPSSNLNETCCAYNLAKLSKDLNCLNPDNTEYMDYYERLLYNQIVGSLNPEHYATTYHYAVGPNADKPWGNATPQESCCGGTGSESHVKYQEAIYFGSDSTLWVGLYIPSRLDWQEKGVTIEQTGEWPSGQMAFTINTAADSALSALPSFDMRLRIPYWAAEDVKISLNGNPLAIDATPGQYAIISTRQWHDGDRVEIDIPYRAYIDYAPDKLEVAAAGNAQTERFRPSWIGTLMLGPLAMTTGDVQGWKDAEIKLDSDLANIQAGYAVSGIDDAHHVAEGTDGVLHTLMVDGREFLPDYYRHNHTTHYLCIQTKDADGDAGYDLNACIAALKEAVTEATRRQENQERTIAEGKQPAWAPHAYGRMLTALKPAKEFLDEYQKHQASIAGKRKIVAKKGKGSYAGEAAEANAERIYDAAAELRAAINAMRPGNLAEPEDLAPLFDAVAKWRQEFNAEVAANGHSARAGQLEGQLRKAASVIRYVGDGSGTPDMITALLQ